VKQYKLRAVEKAHHTVKTARKEFKVPYFETVYEGPIISIEEDQDQALYDFLFKFNGLTGFYQISTELIREKGDQEDE